MTTTASRTPIEIGLIADLACPWCHLGLVRLDRARALRPQLAVRLRWWPFFLNPHLPPDGMDRQTYLRTKFGGEAAARNVYQRIVAAGRADGVEFAFERMTRTPNTLQAQRLILFAEEQGLGETIIRALFEALFLEGRDIGRADELIGIAVAAGLGREEVASFLAGDRHREAVVGSHGEAERLGIRGVPVFVLDRQQVIAGAQPPEVLVGLLDLAAGARQTADAERPAPREAAPAG
jgi:predicted DsbA family dithiol-disulfide isomerase